MASFDTLRALLIALLTLATCYLLIPSSVSAQATDASITGVVSDDSGEVLPGATVVVTNEATGFETGTVTNADGRFTLRQLPLGGPYVLAVSFVGFEPNRITGIELNLGDRRFYELTLSQSVSELDEVIVSANDLRARYERLGSTTAISQRDMQTLPTQDRNFTNLMKLSPLSGRGLNFAGQRSIATNFTIDGMNARGMRTGGEQGRGPFSISMEALREFETHTHNYDVTIGRQAGGGINAATRSGTNEWQAGAFSYLRHNALTSGTDFRGRSIDDQFSNVQWGFTAGGPLVKDRAHFFVSFDRQDAQRPIDVINLSSPDDEISNNLSRTNIGRLIEVGREQYGLGENDQIGSFAQNGVQNSVLARIDWQLNPKHGLTLVNNLTHFTSDYVSGGDRLAIRESRPNRYSLVNTTRLALRSTISDNLLNIAQLQVNYSDDEARQDNGQVPRIFVSVESELSDGSTGQRDIQMGGHRWSPNYSNERNVQFTNTAYLSRGNTTYTFGTDLLASYHDVWISSETFGLFEFNSLEDFENRNPFRYSRLVPLQEGVPGQQFWAMDAGIFGQVEFQPHRDVDLTLGLRYDIHVLLNEPDRNELVADRFGFDTSNRPVDLTNIQPRMQMTWNVGGADRDIVRLGAGGFSSFNNYYSYVTQFLYSGNELASVVLTGDDVPTPDFEAYRADAGNVPGVPAGFGQAPALIAFSGDDAGTPYTFKGNLSYNRFLTNNLRLGVNLTGAYTFNNYHYFDRNLQQFFSVDPDDRPVFVPAESIDEQGNTTYTAGRQHDEFEQVLEMVSEGNSRQYGVTLEGDYAFNAGGQLSASYTWNRTEENTPYNGNNAISALNTRVQGDPRELEWAPASNDFRHKVVLHGSLPEVFGVTLSGSYVGISGAPVNVVVNRDIMGTSTNRDELAFIFDPDDPATPANVAEGMRTVLANAEPRFADYLRDNLGSRAERNALTNPFSGQLNLRLSREFPLPTGQQIDVMFDVFNVMNIFNNEWGAISRFSGNQTLLNVTGFDQETQEYEYSVNENFGQVNRSGTPYQIQLGARLSF